MNANEELAEIARLKYELALKEPRPPFSNIKKYESGRKLFKSTKDTHNKFPFGAIAELIDNAREAGATSLDIDIEAEDEHILSMSFTDNGSGMMHEELYSMLEYGQGTKESNNFGMGFKTGSLTLGNEILVLTKQKNLRGLAFLSRSTNFSEENSAKPSLIVPFVFWLPDGSPATYASQIPAIMPSGPLMPIRSNDDVDPVLKHITSSRNTVIRRLRDLQIQYDKLNTENGTRIVIWGIEERFDFMNTQGTDKDIVVRKAKSSDKFLRQDRHGVKFVNGVDVPADYSLRAYCQVLYRTSDKYSFQIRINGELVQFKDPLAERYIMGLEEHTVFLKSRNDVHQKVKVTAKVGYSPEDQRERRYGFYVYWHDSESTIWKNLQLTPRLVQPFFRHGPDDISGHYDGIMGFLVLNPLTMSIHNGKQTFVEDCNGNWDALGEELDRVYQSFAQRLAEFRGADSILERLTTKDLFFGVSCWAKFKQQWHPARLLNRFDLQQPIPEEVWTTEEWKNAHTDFDLCLVRWLENDEKTYSFVKFADLRGWKKLQPNRPASVSKALIETGNQIYSEMMGDAVERPVQCVLCQKARMARCEESELKEGKWACQKGFMYMGKLNKICDLRELEIDRQHFNDLHVTTLTSEKERISNSLVAQVQIFDFSELPDKQEWELLGKGAYGSVFKVLHEGRIKALKQFEEAKNFRKELKNLCCIRHHHCIQVFARTDEKDKNIALLLELCDTNLEDAIVVKRFSTYIFLDATIQVATGLKYLHETVKIVHADLKPSNILLQISEHEDQTPGPCIRVKICDFGLSRCLKDSSSRQILSRDGTICSSYYIAPEVEKVEDFSFQSDAFSFAWVLCESIVSQLSSWRNEMPRTVAKFYIERQRDDKLMERASLYSKPLEDLIGQCWNERPDARPNFKAILNELKTIKAGKMSHDPTGIEEYIREHRGNSYVYRVLSDCDIEWMQKVKPGEIVSRCEYLKRFTASSDVDVKSTDQGDLIKHVAYGSNPDDACSGSKFISTTCNPQVAFWYLHKRYHLSESISVKKLTSSKFRLYPFVKIDLARCIQHCKVIDLSDEDKVIKQIRIEGKPKYELKIQSYAKVASEVILIGTVPPDAIVERYEIDLNGNLGTLFPNTTLVAIPSKRRPSSKRNGNVFESFKDWQQAFDEAPLSKHIQDFLKECSLVAAKNKHWPVPKRYASVIHEVFPSNNNRNVQSECKAKALPSTPKIVRNVRDSDDDDVPFSKCKSRKDQPYRCSTVETGKQECESCTPAPCPSNQTEPRSYATTQPVIKIKKACLSEVSKIKPDIKKDSGPMKPHKELSKEPSKPSVRNRDASTQPVASKDIVLIEKQKDSASQKRTACDAICNDGGGDDDDDDDVPLAQIRKCPKGQPSRDVNMGSLVLQSEGNIEPSTASKQACLAEILPIIQKDRNDTHETSCSDEQPDNGQVINRHSSQCGQKVTNVQEHCCGVTDSSCPNHPAPGMSVQGQCSESAASGVSSSSLTNQGSNALQPRCENTTKRSMDLLLAHKIPKRSAYLVPSINNNASKPAIVQNAPASVPSASSADSGRGDRQTECSMQACNNIRLASCVKQQSDSDHNEQRACSLFGQTDKGGRCLQESRLERPDWERNISPRPQSRRSQSHERTSHSSERRRTTELARSPQAECAQSNQPRRPTDYAHSYNRERSLERKRFNSQRQSPDRSGECKERRCSTERGQFSGNARSTEYARSDVQRRSGELGRSNKSGQLNGCSGRRSDEQISRAVRSRSGERTPWSESANAGEWRRSNDWASAGDRQRSHEQGWSRDHFHSGGYRRLDDRATSGGSARSNEPRRSIERGVLRPLDQRQKDRVDSTGDGLEMHAKSCQQEPGTQPCQNRPPLENFVEGQDRRSSVQN